MKREESLDRLVHRLKSEFLEMPGLKLTEAQARRMWGLDAASCSYVLENLVKAHFLFKTRDGGFMHVRRER